MGVSVREIKSGKNKGKFVLTSSVTGHEHEPMSREKAILYLHRRSLCDMQKTFIENWFSFPHGWGDGHCRMIGDNEEGYKRWMAWWEETLKKAKGDDEYYAAMQAKYDECMELTKMQAKYGDKNIVTTAETKPT